jgi:hypothetical protein
MQSTRKLMQYLKLSLYRPKHDPATSQHRRFTAQGNSNVVQEGQQEILINYIYYRNFDTTQCTSISFANV